MEPPYSSLKVETDTAFSVFHLAILKAIKRVINLQFPRILLILPDKYIFMECDYCLFIKQTNYII